MGMLVIGKDYGVCFRIKRNGIELSTGKILEENLAQSAVHQTLGDKFTLSAAWKFLIAKILHYPNSSRAARVMLLRARKEKRKMSLSRSLVHVEELLLSPLCKRHTHTHTTVDSPCENVCKHWYGSDWQLTHQGPSNETHGLVCCSHALPLLHMAL